MTRNTRFSDVCGTMDELKRLAVEEPGRLHDQPAAEVIPLLEDALYMIGRMEQRVHEYEVFRERLRDLLAQLDGLDPVGARELGGVVDALGGAVGVVDPVDDVGARGD